jgi:hypothetical protein
MTMPDTLPAGTEVIEPPPAEPTDYIGEAPAADAPKKEKKK